MVVDGRFSVRDVHIGTLDAFKRTERFLDLQRAGGAVHPPYTHRYPAKVRAYSVSELLHGFFHFVRACNSGIVVDVRLFTRKVHDRFTYPIRAFQRLLYLHGAGGAVHPLYGKNSPLLSLVRFLLGHLPYPPKVYLPFNVIIFQKPDNVKVLGSHNEYDIIKHAADITIYGTG